MIQFFNFDFKALNNKSSSKKLVFFGLLFVILGLSSLIFRNLGVAIISWIFASLLLCISYFNLKTINELKRYETRDKIYPYKRNQVILLLSALLLIIFPTKIQEFFSLVLGIYLTLSQIFKLIKNRRNPYYKLNTFNSIVLILGVLLIISPMFLSRFISFFMSMIILILGFIMFSIGKRNF